MSSTPVDDIIKFRELLNKTPKQLNESFDVSSSVESELPEDDSKSFMNDIVSEDDDFEENLTEADGKQDFLNAFTTIRNAAVAMSKGQETQINVANKVRNDLYNFLQWMEATYGKDYADQVWDHFDLGPLRSASGKYEMAGAPAPTEEYIDDVISTFGVLIKYVQKMKDPAQPTQ